MLVESITAGLTRLSAGLQLQSEGRAMLEAMFADARATPGVTPLLLETGPAPAEARLDAALQTVDAVWLLAPETGGELAWLTERVERSRCCLFGSRISAVRLASSKWATRRALWDEAQGPLPVALDRRPLGPSSDWWVLKPDDGCGAADVRRVADAALDAVLPAATPATLVEPWVDGEALSLSLLTDGQTVWLLSINRQSIDWQGGRARYCGGVVNVDADRDAALALARSVVAAIPGLWGYVGVDCVCGRDGRWVPIEVNPRLTTPFAHLSAATGVCLLGAMLDLLAGRAPQLPRGRGRSVHFSLEVA